MMKSTILTFALAVFAVVINIFLWLALIYTVVHFTMKYW